MVSVEELMTFKVKQRIGELELEVARLSALVEILQQHTHTSQEGDAYGDELEDTVQD